MFNLFKRLSKQKRKITPEEEISTAKEYSVSAGVDTVQTNKRTNEKLPDAPYGPKISSITDAGIEFYWKKVENTDGYEVFRAYTRNGSFEKIAQIESKNKGTYIDADFDTDRKKVYYKARSYLKSESGEYSYSDFTKAATAVFCDELKLERDVTYMYDGTSRKLRAFYGWGEVRDLQWTSDNEHVAQILPDGTIRAKSSGEAILTCTSISLNKQASSKVVVNRESMEPLDTGSRRYVFNPQTKHWENAAAEKTGDAVIMMVGDMMCGSAQTKKQFIQERGWSYNDSYDYVRKTTAQSDFAVGNLETLMAAGWPYMIDESYIDNKNNCNSPSRYLDAVLHGGFDAVTMSNNHNCDGGVRALLQTIDEAERRKIPYTGVFKNAENDRFMIVNVNGIKLGFLAYNSRYTGFNGKDADWSEEEKAVLLNVFSGKKVQKDVQDCKAAGAEYVIAYMHWGKKNYKSITKRQKQEAQEAADAGVDYIVGANPHVLQEYDEIITEDGRCVPCFYSTGNFQAYMNQIPGNRDSVMVRIRLKRQETGKVTLEENQYIPYHTYDEVNGCNWAPVAISEKYDKGVNISDRNKYFFRIKTAIGNKTDAR